MNPPIPAAAGVGGSRLSVPLLTLPRHDDADHCGPRPRGGWRMSGLVTYAELLDKAESLTGRGDLDAAASALVALRRSGGSQAMRPLLDLAAGLPVPRLTGLVRALLRLRRDD